MSIYAEKRGYSADRTSASVSRTVQPSTKQSLADNSARLAKLASLQALADGTVCQRRVISIGNGRFFSDVTNQVYTSQFAAEQAEFAHLEGPAPGLAQTPQVAAPQVAAVQAPQQQGRAPGIYSAVPPPSSYAASAPSSSNVLMLLRARETGQMSSERFRQAVLALNLEDRRALEQHPQLANLPDVLDILG